MKHANEDRLFIMTGAGISAESGIPTFRDVNGLWKGRWVEEVASIATLLENPELFWGFYSMRREGALPAKPNAAHEAIAMLEFEAQTFICTQNVDDLHEKGGSSSVTHYHGHLWKTRCSNGQCENSKMSWGDRVAHKIPPKCNLCGSTLRPDIVLFGEAVKEVITVHKQLMECTHYYAIGTSGVVQPAAGFVTGLKQFRPKVPRIYFGLERPQNAEDFNEIVLGPATVTVPQFFGK